MAINAEKLYELACDNLHRVCMALHSDNAEHGEALYNMAIKDPYVCSSITSINSALEIYAMAKDELGKAKSGTAYSAYKRIVKRNKNVRRNLEGVWTDAEGRCCVCDGYLAVRMNKPVDGFETVSGVDLDKIFPAPGYFSDPVELTLPTPGELKLNKKKLYKGKAVYDFGDDLPCVDAAFLKDVMDCLPGAKAITENHATNKMIYFTSDKGDAILLPVRKAA